MKQKVVTHLVSMLEDTGKDLHLATHEPQPATLYALAQTASLQFHADIFHGCSHYSNNTMHCLLCWNYILHHTRHSHYDSVVQSLRIAS